MVGPGLGAADLLISSDAPRPLAQGHGVGLVHRFHAEMSARCANWPEIRGFLAEGAVGAEIADPSAPVTTGSASG